MAQKPSNEQPQKDKKPERSKQSPLDKNQKDKAGNSKNPPLDNHETDRKWQ